MAHTQAIAERLAETLLNNKSDVHDETFPTLVYCSPFRRCAHTAHEIAKKLRDTAAAASSSPDESTTNSQATAVSSVAVRVEEGLTEWLTPSLVVHKESGTRSYPNTPHELVENYKYDTIDLSYLSVNRSVHSKEYELSQSGLDASNPGNISPEYPESEKRLLLRARTTLDNIMDALLEETSLLESAPPSLVIVSHAPCMQALAYNLLGRGDGAAEQITPWPLGGITAFSRLVARGLHLDDEDDHSAEEDEWKLEYYCNTDHMPQEYKDGLEAWSLPGFTKTTSTD
jgi:phosphohistidine phosphatase SixA